MADEYKYGALVELVGGWGTEKIWESPVPR
jgi:hypothetical protein